MVDVSVNTEIKTVGVPPVPAVEVEDRSKPRIMPVKKGTDSSGTALDDKALHGKGGKERRSDQEKLARDIEHIEAKLDEMGTSLGLTLHRETDEILVQIKDRESGELIRQFPSEEVVKLRQKLDELAGLLFDDHV